MHLGRIHAEAGSSLLCLLRHRKGAGLALLWLGSFSACVLQKILQSEIARQASQLESFSAMCYFISSLPGRIAAAAWQTGQARAGWTCMQHGLVGLVLKRQLDAA